MDTYKSQAADWGGYATTLNGYPAWIDPPNDDSEASASFSGVHMVIGGIEVTLWGKMPLDDLVSVAETVSA